MAERERLLAIVDRVTLPTSSAAPAKTSAPSRVPVPSAATLDPAPIPPDADAKKSRVLRQTVSSCSVDSDGFPNVLKEPTAPAADTSSHKVGEYSNMCSANVS